jgi:hypothetical protein
MPDRIQLRRTKGWRKPYEVVVVARPSEWGNPFRVVPVHRSGPFDVVLGADGFCAQSTGLADAREIAVARFRAAIHPAAPENLPGYPGYAAIYRELRGRDLACWCPLDQPCHADVLLEIANGPMPAHEHDQRFDGDDPYLVCWCGARWDAVTGRPLGGGAS